MITYDRSAFGLNLIFRVHGSAIYRSIIPGMLAVVTLIVIRYIQSPDGSMDASNRTDNEVQHPYSIGILVGSISFLIVFRASQGYSRYWEAAGAIHQMQSKWLDAIIHTGCYHMQCGHYDSIKPPSFFDYPELNAYFLTRDRERYHEVSHDKHKDVLNDLDDGIIPEEEDPSIVDETQQKIDHSQRHLVVEASAPEKIPKPKRISRAISERSTDMDPILTSKRVDNSDIVDRAVLKSINSLEVTNTEKHVEREDRLKRRYAMDKSEPGGPAPLTGAPRLDGNWGKLFPDRKATFYQPRDTDPSSPNYLNNVPSFASHQGGRTPSLFLQELVHLCSLMNAVALSTLRNDMEGSVSPLGVYKPGSPWPEVDPDKLDSYYLNGSWSTRMIKRIQYFLGTARSPEERTRYNAARPLEVLGGVSDSEIRFLQMARGPLAKTQLCWYWMTEYIIREHLNGSTGKVGPPIISRVIQFLSDGMVYYNHARKITFVPFPFPHAQLSVFFVLIAIPAVAFLMDQYADNIVLASILCFFAVVALSGIHEVARELENPFRNIPNELPVCTFQAQFNEGLLVMYSGYHPDHFWDPTKHDHHPTDPSPKIRKFGTKSRKGGSPRLSTVRKVHSADGSSKRHTIAASTMMAGKRAVNVVTAVGKEGVHAVTAVGKGGVGAVTAVGKGGVHAVAAVGKSGLDAVASVGESTLIRRPHSTGSTPARPMTDDSANSVTPTAVEAAVDSGNNEGEGSNIISGERTA
ncbi:Bestrophin, RFP-TM, chloride channel [Seminavis robusta]|uniref:Bestrophin, RFP-TM, chloride channel n=1 Tax=Seminavis robusta TaxID=568900 RepID=A0A9N8H2W1_9STRA|nr:Bestrophin, RFP-TM, chloride channel [Seminavis robusta]|eukprot:Sro25_g017300.1 Bestrophin, RFP-TM, chloride channel (747) ;mRNA; r:149405-151901